MCVREREREYGVTFIFTTPSPRSLQQRRRQEVRSAGGRVQEVPRDACEHRDQREQQAADRKGAARTKTNNTQLLPEQFQHFPSGVKESPKYCPMFIFVCNIQYQWIYWIPCCAATETSTFTEMMCSIAKKYIDKNSVSNETRFLKMIT